jgi:transcriptional regulator with XRE-family HTH domain
MARRMGVSQPAVAQFELSSSNPTLSTIVRYANKLGVELQLSVK